MENNDKYYRSRQFQRLLHHFEHGISEGQVPYMEADELTDIAEYYMAQKKDDRANQAIRAAINMHPDSIDPQIFMARQKMYYGKLDEARSIIDAITEQDDLEVIYMRAELLIKENRDDKASQYLLRQMHQMQDDLTTYLYDCTSIFMDYNRWELANEWLGRLRDVDPNHPDLTITEAEILMGLDHYDEALPLLQQIIDDDPYDTEAWDLLAETQVALENYTEAQEAADFALAINPEDSDAILMKANALMNSQQQADAIEHYRHYLKLQPDDINAHISLALCYTNQEHYKESLPLLRAAEKLASKMPDKETELSQILQIKAFTMSHLDMFREALNTIDSAKAITPKTSLWKCHITEGDIYLRGGQFKQAQGCFTKALDCCQYKAETLFNIALSYMGADYYKAAIVLLEDVWTIYGYTEGSFVIPYLANCYLNLENREEFLHYLKQAPSCDREATYILFHDRYPGIEPEEYYNYELNNKNHEDPL